MASWPSVAYTVVMVMPHASAPCAEIIQSADVSASSAAMHSPAKRPSIAISQSTAQRAGQ